MTRLQISFGLLCALGLGVLPACSARTSLSDTSGRATRAIFHIQAKERKVTATKPLTADEAKAILNRYERGGKNRQGGGRASRTSTASGRPVATGAMTRVRRVVE